MSNQLGRPRGNRAIFISAWAACVSLAVALPLPSQVSDPWSPQDVLEPAALAKMLKGSEAKPLILQVGFERLYKQGHIPGSPYCGPASNPQGIERLKGCLDNVPRSREIILYCGCCPWSQCPNIRPAFRALADMGYHNVKVLHIAQDFGKNWIRQGYPVARK